MLLPQWLHQSAFPPIVQKGSPFSTSHQHLFFVDSLMVAFLTAWLDLENIMLCEISPSEKDKHHMISLICGI